MFRWPQIAIADGLTSEQIVQRLLEAEWGIHLRHSVILTILLVVIGAPSPAAATDAAARWRQEAIRTEIMRDDWGIAHVHGKTDADAVFGMVYAQAEDDFNRVETNYINCAGPPAEAEGEKRRSTQDLRHEAVHRSRRAQRANTPPAPRGCKALMNAWADGLNYYLATHPEVKPRVIQRFEPWMALSFTEGSIGGDIERVQAGPVKAFYGNGSRQPHPARRLEAEPAGSNGIAIAPANTRDHPPCCSSIRTRHSFSARNCR